MKNLTLENIAKACGGTYFGSEADKTREVSDVTMDSRTAGEGSLFLAIPGERVDGHKFIPDVFAKGAAAVISEQKLQDPAGPYILVKSSTQALKDIAEFYRSTLHIKIIGITGSVGKTSTKEMIAAVLSQKYNVLKTEGNFNNEIGMPLTLLRIREEHEVAVIEMGISDFGEMHRLAKIARPDICVMTNIGQCHLEFLHTRDGILKAKSEIFDYLKPDGVIILNGNDDKLSTIHEVKGIRPHRYFVEDGSAPRREDSYDICIRNIRDCGMEGMEADMVFPEETCQIHEAIPGIHNLYNAGAAACVGRAMGLTNAEIVSGIASAQTIAGRLNMIHLRDGIMVIDDCYNANPSSMKAALGVLSYATGRKIAVLGDMGELGDDTKAMHTQVGRAVAENHIDVLLCAGELSENMAKAAKEAGVPEVRHFDSRDALLEELEKTVRPGDAILVKASHFMGYPKIVKTLQEKFRQ